MPRHGKKLIEYVVTKDIVIPKGTIFTYEEELHVTAHEALLHIGGLSNNTHFEINMSKDDADELPEYFTRIRR